MNNSQRTGAAQVGGVFGGGWELRIGNSIGSGSGKGNTDLYTMAGAMLGMSSSQVDLALARAGLGWDKPYVSFEQRQAALVEYTKERGGGKLITPWSSVTVAQPGTRCFLAGKN